MRQTFQKQRKDHRGLTLIEMVITIAIIGIFVTVVATFITSGSNMYRKVSTTAKLQTDMQTTVESIKNLLLDTNDRIVYTVDGQQTENDIDSTADVDKKLLLIISDDSILTGREYILQWKAEDRTLLYTSGMTDKTSVLAEHVTNFTVDTSKARDGKEVRFRLTMENKGKEITELCTVALRNPLSGQQ